MALIIRLWVLSALHKQVLRHVGRLERGKFARNVNLGCLKAGGRMFDSHKLTLSGLAESAEFSAFGEDHTSCEDVYAERNQDTTPRNL